MDHRARPAARLTVLTGPPGVGVENLVERVRARVPWSWRSVSMTTRPRRRDEIDGVHHFFVGHDEFDRMVAGGHLLEWAQIADDRYGTSRDETLVHLWAGRPVLLPLDERGVEQVRTTMPDVRVVRLVPRAVAPASVAGHGADTLVVVDSAERAVDKLVGLLGSSFLAPARQSG